MTYERSFSNGLAADAAHGPRSVGSSGRAPERGVGPPRALSRGVHHNERGQGGHAGSPSPSV
ncbi:MAG: hypothetical protein ACO35I_09350, partial [Burkholderiaceae bacterium]